MLFNQCLKFETVLEIFGKEILGVILSSSYRARVKKFEPFPNKCVHKNR